MRKLFVFLFAAMISLSLQAQNNNDPVVFEINGQKILKSEFMNEFLRSVGKDPKAAPTACTYEKRQALEEYVQLFVNYRTKLVDAYAQQIDKDPSLIKELEGYRNELAAPYLIDSVTLNNILEEAYERNHYTLNAAHIFVRLVRNPSPEDTLKAYNKAMSYYKRVMSGEDFMDVAKEAAMARFDEDHVPPEDPRRQDLGNLGNFTVFDMVYPFESASYALQPGQVSLPVRSAYGYHVIKLFNKTPFYGKATFQHIWISEDPQKRSAEGRARQAYQKISEGENFGKVASDYSDDHTSAVNGGLLSDMNIHQLPPDYVVELAKLKPGEFSKPFHSTFGWHILLLIRRDTIPSFNDMQPYYRQRLARDNRNLKPRSVFVDQCKERYSFIDYTKTYMKSPAGKKGQKNKRFLASLDECRAALSDSVFSRSWRYSDDMVTDMRPLFSVADKEYTAKDLLLFIQDNQRAESSYSLDMYLEDRYENFINNKVFEYADSHLEEEHPEFANLMDEYRNGLMIFSYNDKMIWSKAISDSVGLAGFYSQFSAQRDIDNPDDAPYFWGERLDMSIITVFDSSTMAPAKALKMANKCKKKGQALKTVFDNINEKDPNAVKYEDILVQSSDQNYLKMSSYHEGLYVVPATKGYSLVSVNKVLNPCLKSCAEARGFYINEYQNYLEKQLMESLRSKYHVKIYQNVIDEITY
ncbi:MAG: peptidylprolyl isomerase [Bacteroidales bacterium]|nr:peptidylprolyl isomerase [Bacteroidales bacterium]